MMAGAVTPATSRTVHFAGLLGQSNRQAPGTARRFTPYRKTPASRRIQSARRSPVAGRASRSAAPETDEENLAIFTKKTFQAYKVTPLYQFSYKPRDLKQYGRLLAAYLEAERTKGTAVEVEENVDRAIFTVVEGIKQGEGDADTIEISLKAKRGPQQIQTIVLTALLCSVHNKSDLLPHPDSGDFTTLPVLLVKGAVTLARPLCTWLESMFDCSVSLFHLDATSLSWMVAMWSGEVAGRTPKPVELQYAIPKQIGGLNRITMTIEPHDCRDLWESIHDREEDDFKEEEVIVFMKSLELHFYHFFRMHLSRMHLTRIGTAVALIGVNGKMKIFSEHHVIPILAHLTEVCAEDILNI